MQSAGDGRSRDPDEAAAIGGHQLGVTAHREETERHPQVLLHATRAAGLYLRQLRLPSRRGPQREDKDAVRHQTASGRPLPGTTVDHLPVWPTSGTSSARYGDEAKLVLYNTARCPRKWHRHFNRISFLPFHLQEQKEKKAAFLNTTAAFHMAELTHLQCDVLQLPYSGQHQLMYIFLPKTLTGLAQLEKDMFDPDTCYQWYSRLEKMPVRLVNVSVPVFHIGAFKSLKNVLVQMGLERMFDPKAGAFSRWTNSPDFCIDEYYQDIKVDFEFRGKYSPPSQKSIRRMTTKNQLGQITYFTADHPFLFIIHDRPSGTIQYIGRVCHPLNRLIPS